MIKRGIAVLTGAALLGAVPGVEGATQKTVELGDNYYAPKTVTVDRGATVTWRWPSFDQAGDVHDVKLSSAPRGVKKFHSQPASASYTFKRTLEKPGRYKIICTLHEEMKMTITVRR